MENEQPIDLQQGQSGSDDEQSSPQAILKIMPEDALELVLVSNPNLDAFLITVQGLIGYTYEETDGDGIPENVAKFLKTNRIPAENITKENYLEALDFLDKVGRRVYEKRKTLGVEGAIQSVMDKLSDVFDALFGKGIRPTKSAAKSYAQAAAYVILNFNNAKNSYDVVHETEKGFMSEMENYVYDCFKSGKLNYRPLYARPDIWIAVEQSKEYIASRRGEKILEKNMDEIIELTSSGQRTVRVIDLGMGSATKGILINTKIIEANKTVKYNGVDSSPTMLKAGTVMMVENFISILLNEELRAKLPENSEWKNFIEFIQKYELDYSKNHLLRDVLYRIFYKYINLEWFEKEIHNKGKEPDLFKHMAARILDLHKKRPTQHQLINKLDHEVDSPLSVNPILSDIKDLDHSLFVPSDTESVIAFDLGCRACNQHPKETIDLYNNLLSEPECEGVQDPPKTPEDEAKIKAGYVVSGMQISHFTKESTKSQFEEEKTKISNGYNNDESIDFITYPFKFDFISYEDPDTASTLSFYDLTENNEYISLVTEYEEDPDNKDFYRIVHKLVLKKRLKIKVGNHDLLLKNPGDNIILIVSYKPTLEQMIELYTKNGLNICNVYKDNETCPKYVKFLLRKMTAAERELFMKSNNATDERIEELKAKFCPGYVRKDSLVFKHSSGEPGQNQ